MCHVTRYTRIVILSFADKRTEPLWVTGNERRLPPDIARRAVRKLSAVDAATTIDDRRSPPGNRLHALEGDRAGQHSISINDQWRVRFRAEDGDAFEVEVRDDHESPRKEEPMSIPNTRRLQRRPVHPGELLREEFVPEYGLTAARLAAALGVSRQSVYELLRERRALSPEMAVRLARLFGNSPDFWLNLQRAVDLHEAHAAIEEDVRRIEPLHVT